jgi:hypothetical protein
MKLDLIEKVTLYLSPSSNSSVFVYPNNYMEISWILSAVHIEL